MKDETYRRLVAMAKGMFWVSMAMLIAVISLEGLDAPAWGKWAVVILLVLNPAWYREGRR